MEKNKRAKVLKEEVINEITLNDLLDFGSKAQIAVMQLTDNCMKFNDSHLRQLSARVNKDVGDLCDQIRSAIITNQQEQMNPTKEPLDQKRPGDNMIEKGGLNGESLGESKKKKVSNDTKNFLKKLLEAIEGEEETEEVPPVPEAPIKSPEIKPEVASETKTIDLSPAFTEVLEGLSPEQFISFKGELVNSLKGSGITDPGFQTIVNEIEKTAQIDDLNYALDSLYDYGDENGIEIKTEGITETETSEPEGEELETEETI